MNKLDVENNTLYISGTLIKCKYDYLITGKTASGELRKSKDMMYQFAVKSKVSAEIKAQVKSTYYANSEPQFTPKWLSEKDDEVILNFKSLYDVKYFIQEEGAFKAYSYDDMIEKFGRAPLSSDVTLNITCKDGAMYVRAIRFDNVKEVSVNDFF